jgi:hypothetical protein
MPRIRAGEPHLALCVSCGCKPGTPHAVSCVYRFDRAARAAAPTIPDPED